MKKIFKIIFVILFILLLTPADTWAILPAPEPDPHVKPVLMKTQGLKVYIPKNDMLSTMMRHAFMDWQKRTDNNFTFEFVGTKSTANIEVIFLESGMNIRCKNGDALGCTTYAAAKTLYGNKRILGTKIYISMLDNKGKLMTKNQIYTIMLHEVGHALGLEHSEDENSLMYKGTNSNMAEDQEIQSEDIKTLYELYGIE